MAIENLIKVKRFLLTPKSTIGDLFFNDVFICNTLEDIVRLNGEKVYGETAVPAGEYNMKMSFWETYNADYPHLLNVPNFTGILIHPGTEPGHTEGCLLPGFYDPALPDQVNSSRLIYRKVLLPNIKTALANGTLKIKITNEFPITDFVS